MAKRYKKQDNTIFIILALGVFATLALPAIKVAAQQNIQLIIFIFVSSILALAILFMIGIKLFRRTRKLNLTFAEIDLLSGHDFENYVYDLLQTQGYKTRITGTNGGDYGVDIVIERENIKTAVQVKRYSGLVGIEAVYQAVAGANYYHCHKSMVVTNSTFTPQAINLAKANNCVLIDRSQLKSWLTAKPVISDRHEAQPLP